MCEARVTLWIDSRAALERIASPKTESPCTRSAIAIRRLVRATLGISRRVPSERGSEAGIERPSRPVAIFCLTAGRRAAVHHTREFLQRRAHSAPSRQYCSAAARRQRFRLKKVLARDFSGHPTLSLSVVAFANSAPVLTLKLPGILSPERRGPRRKYLDPLALQPRPWWKCDWDQRTKFPRTKYFVHVTARRVQSS